MAMDDDDDDDDDDDAAFSLQKSFEPTWPRMVMLMMMVMMMMVVVMMTMIRTSACLTSLLNKNLSCDCMARGDVAAALRPRAPGVNVVSCRLDCDGQVIRPGEDQH